MKSHETLAHLSDLHIGKTGATQSCRKLCDALLDSNIGHVIISGDITDHGKSSEFRTFKDIFKPLIDADKLTVVPGNHDRLGDDIGDNFTRGKRVRVINTRGLHIVCADSTASHNRSLLSGHGVLHSQDVEDIIGSFDGVQNDMLRCLVLHHHLLPLPAEGLWENVSAWLNLPWAAEVSVGHKLLERLYGKCDLILHGHRHSPGEMKLGPVSICNAGSSSMMKTFRVFRHKHGVISGKSQWVKL